MQAKKGLYRTGVSCKSKFEKLAFRKCPTGTADIPIHVLQAKELKEEISGHEMIGFVSGNGPEFDYDDEYDSTNLLSPSKSCWSSNRTQTLRISTSACSVESAGTELGKGVGKACASLVKTTI